MNVIGMNFEIDTLDMGADAYLRVMYIKMHIGSMDIKMDLFSLYLEINTIDIHHESHILGVHLRLNATRFY